MSLAVGEVPSEAHLPFSVDVVIIGGGIIGASAALYLAKRGVSVALCEKGHISGEQSSRNWGWVRQGQRDLREIPLMIQSMRIWDRMNEEVEGETGFCRTGIMFAAGNEKEVAHNEAWLNRARPYQIDARMVSGAELDRVMPGGARHWTAALYCGSDGRAEPLMATTAIASAAQRRGAVVLSHCAVRGVELSGGRVSGVVTERGRVGCTAAVVAAGAWSRRFLKDLGLSLPQLKVRGSVMRTSPVDGGPEPALWSGEFAFRRRPDGGYNVANGQANVVSIVPDGFLFFTKFLPTLVSEFKSLRLRIDGRFTQEWSESRPVPLDQISPYEKTRVLDPEPDKVYLREAFHRLVKAFPAFSSCRVVQEWAGLMDVTPDAIPVISSVENIPGLTIATGFSGHGFGIGPAAGHLVADLVAGTQPIVDPTEFRFSRFNGSACGRPITRL
ncbi:FAD-binding oxidoreductase [Mesorhizobium sp. M0041]|uniref:NAD(P)/FAD-dependent oxidoreductase n=1 Tax=Mesorhizobium sp. M0041 TaxID=2956856 RepID=UPI00333B596B